MSQRFKWIIEGERTGPDSACDVDLAKHEDWALVPTLGSLMPGWLLLVPRKPALSMSRLDVQDRRRGLELASEVSACLMGFGERRFVFEHGAGADQSVVGCGVDQAHLHVIASDLDLFATVLCDENVEWHEVAPDDPWRSSVIQAVDYYFISDGEKSYVGFAKQSQSQYFRRKIAEAIGCSDKWDYRSWPNYENIQRTIKYFNDGWGRQAA